MVDVFEIFSQAVILGVGLSSAPLAVAFLIGLVVAVLQTLTQVQEQTISYFPKVLGILITLYLCASLALDKLKTFMIAVFAEITKI